MDRRLSNVNPLYVSLLESIEHGKLARLLSVCLDAVPAGEERKVLLEEVKRLSRPSALVTAMMMNPEVLNPLSERTHSKDFVCREETVFPLFHAPPLVCKTWKDAFGKKPKIIECKAGGNEWEYAFKFVKKVIFFDTHMVVSLPRRVGGHKNLSSLASCLKNLGDACIIKWGNTKQCSDKKEWWYKFEHEFKARKIQLLRTYVNPSEKGRVYKYPWLLHVKITPTKQTLTTDWWKTVTLQKNMRKPLKLRFRPLDSGENVVLPSIHGGTGIFPKHVLRLRDVDDDNSLLWVGPERRKLEDPNDRENRIRKMFEIRRRCENCCYCRQQYGSDSDSESDYESDSDLLPSATLQNP